MSVKPDTSATATPSLLGFKGIIILSVSPETLVLFDDLSHPHSPSLSSSSRPRKSSWSTGKEKESPSSLLSLTSQDRVWHHDWQGKWESREEARESKTISSSSLQNHLFLQCKFEEGLKQRRWRGSWGETQMDDRDREVESSIRGRRAKGNRPEALLERNVEGKKYEEMNGKEENKMKSIPSLLGFILILSFLISLLHLLQETNGMNPKSK